jgi:hypothetical protein
MPPTFVYDLSPDDPRSACVALGYSFWPTSEDWHPSFDPPEDGRGGFVIVRIVPLIRGGYRVVVCGADDSGCERDVPTMDEARAIVCALPSIITRDHLRAIGFSFW